MLDSFLEVEIFQIFQIKNSKTTKFFQFQKDHIFKS